jgi:FtsP/CotA-like multicopper oxidase with cupredoxin domain
MRQRTVPVIITLSLYAAALILLGSGRGLAVTNNRGMQAAANSGMVAKQDGMGGKGSGAAFTSNKTAGADAADKMMKRTTPAERQAAADRATAMRLLFEPKKSNIGTLQVLPTGSVDYFGNVPNYANSQFPELTPAAVISLSQSMLWTLGPAFCDATKTTLTSGDYNGDGKTDVGILYDYGNMTTEIWLLLSDGVNYTPLLAWSSGAGNCDATKCKVVSGDFDSDGKDDMAVMYDYGNATTRIWKMKSNGSTLTPSLAWYSGAGNSDAAKSKIVAGDFDGDSFSDVAILYDYGSGMTRAWFLKSNGTTMTPSLAWTSGAGNCDWTKCKFAAGDYDGNGLIDIALLYDYGSATSRIWTLTSNGTTLTPTVAWFSGAGNSDATKAQITSGDFNADGKSDIAMLYDYGNMLSRVWTFISNGATMAPEMAWSSGAGNCDATKCKLIAGDFDGSGTSSVGLLYDYGNATSRFWTFKPGASFTVVPNTGIRKFVDTLPGLGQANANNVLQTSGVGQYLPVAHPDNTINYPSTASYPGSDYYEIAVIQYTEKLHSDLLPTTLRGYVQLETPINAATSLHVPLLYPTGSPILDNTGNPVFGYDRPNYLGPTIVANKNVPVRVKFYNYLPTNAGGDLFIPVDESVMGAGMGPGGTEAYKQNRAVIHLHGGATPWISDGTPHQWITPFGETTSFPQGVSVYNVPDMPDPGPGNPTDGTQTFFYTNDQTSRLMFYHDHSYGTTRLNVYAGEAAGYVLRDSEEDALVNGGTIASTTIAAGTIPSDELPLIIQDKTFVPDSTTPYTNSVGTFASQLAAQDPTWNTTGWGTKGKLWFPHVYMPNQNPADLIGGANAMGRWDYGPWFWPPLTASAGLINGPVANPLYGTNPLEPSVNPGVPNPSLVPEAFMDTPLVNGTAYPYVKVGQKAYRFRILNACNDRNLNLQLYFAKSNTPDSVDGLGNPTLQTNSGDVPMVPAVPHPNSPAWPATWPTDGRDGGVPDPAASGPSMIQIGTEGGFLPAPVVLPNTPVGYEYNRRNIVVLNVSNKTLFLGPAERADVIVDFSGVPDGSKLILYNDSPAPVPASDPRYDYYTGGPDLTSTGGAPSTLAGYGPNTRTLMQIQVTSSLGTAAPFNLAALQAALPVAFTASQPPVVVPQPTYPDITVANTNNHAASTTYSKIQDTSLTFNPVGVPVVGTPVTGTGAVGSVNVTATGTGFTSAPLVTFTPPGPIATAGALATLSVTNVAVTSGGSGYTTAPTVAFAGGGGAGATAVANISGGAVTSVTITDNGRGYSTMPAVSFTGGGGGGAVANATGGITEVMVTNGGLGFVTPPAVGFTGGGGTAAVANSSFDVTMPMEPKAIQELFELNYGRMNATLGVELPFTNFNIQTTIPLGYIDPLTEEINMSATPGPVIKGDGTQIWKITHNGVDTHAIHFHLFNVQLINRVGWDGAIVPPDANELGWKETVRMHPLQDAIVALRPVTPTLPWTIPSSNRPMDPTTTVGAPMTVTNPLDGNPLAVTNDMTDFGWEYVWHCHLLGHEENDMMRPIAFRTEPRPDTLTGVSAAAPNVTLNWLNQAPAAAPIPAVTSYTIQRATDATFTTGLTTFSTPAPATSYADTTAVSGTTYFYRVKSLGGVLADSTWSNVTMVVVP